MQILGVGWIELSENFFVFVALTLVLTKSGESNS